MIRKGHSGPDRSGTRSDLGKASPKPKVAPSRYKSAGANLGGRRKREGRCRRRGTHGIDVCGAAGTGTVARCPFDKRARRGASDWSLRRGLSSVSVSFNILRFVLLVGERYRHAISLRGTLVRRMMQLFLS
jgi:hypothetical protein